jgi:hypothetical protein
MKFVLHREGDDIKGEVMREADGKVQTARLSVARVKANRVRRFRSGRSMIRWPLVGKLGGCCRVIPKRLRIYLVE